MRILTKKNILDESILLNIRTSNLLLVLSNMLLKLNIFLLKTRTKILQCNQSNDLRRLPTIWFSYNRIYTDQTLPARVTRECSWAAINLFKAFNFNNNYFCRYFRVSTDKKTVVLPYNCLSS